MPKDDYMVSNPSPSPTTAPGVIADVSLSIQIIHDGRAARLVPIGELDVQSAGTFAIAAQLVVEEHPEHLHVDLSQVTFIDSSGARGVYALVSLAAEHGVACSIIGREDLFARRPGDRESIVVWSGATTRQIDLPHVDRARGD